LPQWTACDRPLGLASRPNWAICGWESRSCKICWAWS